MIRWSRSIIVVNGVTSLAAADGAKIERRIRRMTSDAMVRIFLRINDKDRRVTGVARLTRNSDTRDYSHYPSEARARWLVPALLKGNPSCVMSSLLSTGYRNEKNWTTVGVSEKWTTVGSSTTPKPKATLPKNAMEPEGDKPFDPLAAEGLTPDVVAELNAHHLTPAAVEYPWLDEKNWATVETPTEPYDDMIEPESSGRDRATIETDFAVLKERHHALYEEEIVLERELQELIDRHDHLIVDPADIAEMTAEKKALEALHEHRGVHNAELRNELLINAIKLREVRIRCLSRMRSYFERQIKHHDQQ